MTCCRQTVETNKESRGERAKEELDPDVPFFAGLPPYQARWVLTAATSLVLSGRDKSGPLIRC